MIDFKSQLAKDMKVFHNVKEMAVQLNVCYQGKDYYIPVVMDHTEAKNRKQSASDHADGIFEVDAVAYMALEDIKTVPKKGRQIEIGSKDTGYVNYIIDKSGCEDGEVMLELRVYEE